VSGGEVSAEIGMLSVPMTLMSCGTRTPRCRRRSSRPNATTSLYASTAVEPSAMTRSAAATPPETNGWNVPMSTSSVSGYSSRSATNASRRCPWDHDRTGPPT
jgi:hypothetical protein